MRDPEHSPAHQTDACRACPEEGHPSDPPNTALPVHRDADSNAASIYSGFSLASTMRFK